MKEMKISYAFVSGMIFDSEKSNYEDFKIETKPRNFLVEKAWLNTGKKIEKACNDTKKEIRY